jgi:hypothetical protein
MYLNGFTEFHCSVIGDSELYFEVPWFEPHPVNGLY